MMNPSSEKYNTELDQQLQKIATTDWPAFVQLVGEGSILLAKVCYLKKNGKSLQQISSKFKKSKGWAQHHVENNCDCN